MSRVVSVKVRGEFALFTRPELKVERISYIMMTPSAARGVLDAILFKPQMRWHVRRIVALEPDFPDDFPEAARKRPYRLVGIRRNEIQGKISTRNIDGWSKNPASFEPYLVDSAGREAVQGANRTQRNSLVLHHVSYVIEASPILTDKAGKPRLEPIDDDDDDRGPDSQTKYAEMFERRVRKGQCFHRPYLGCREFACDFRPLDGSEKEKTLSDWNESLGLMLYDIRFGRDGVNRPGFFHAKIAQGVLHCDTERPGPDDQPPVDVLGWNRDEQTADRRNS